MTTSENFKRHLAMLKKNGGYVELGSEGHKRLLSGGYKGLTEERAKRIPFPSIR